MSFRTAAAAALLAVSPLACSGGPAEAKPVSAETFAGSWRSVTRSYEHLRLTVKPSAVQQGILHTRLTFSGVAWEGPGRIEGDSLVLDITTSSLAGAAVIAHEADNGALSVRVQSGTAAPVSLLFVRGE
jgi:hypothetical protein